MGYGDWERTYFPKLVGLRVEDVRADYCRMRMPQNERSPGADIIDVAIAVDVPKIGALAAREEDRRSAGLALGDHPQRRAVVVLQPVPDEVALLLDRRREVAVPDERAP